MLRNTVVTWMARYIECCHIIIIRIMIIIIRIRIRIVANNDVN